MKVYDRSPFLRGRPGGGRIARRTVLLTLGGALLLLLLYPVVGANGLSAFLRLRGDRSRMQTEVDRLEAEQARLTEEIAAMQRDPNTLERIARERYNLQRTDEQVLRLVPVDTLR
jgi:cell division protein FtsB